MEGKFNELGGFLETLTSSKSNLTQVNKAATDIVAFVRSEGINVLESYEIINNLITAINFKASPSARQGGFIAIEQIAKTLGSSVEPYLIPLLPTFIEKLSDKDKNVRESVQTCLNAIIDLINPLCAPIVLPILFEWISEEKKWQQQQGAYILLGRLVPKCGVQIENMLPEIVPIVSEGIWNVKEEVSNAASNTMLKLCRVIDNPDVVNVLADVVGCIGDPAKVPQAVEVVCQTTFVKSVRSPLLSVMMPLLARGLAERSNLVKRRCAVITDNMCRLVPDAREILPFLPLVLPGLQRIVDIGGDPDMVAVTARAIITLRKVSGMEIPQELIDASDYDASRPVIASLTHSTTKRDLDKMELINRKMETVNLRKQKRKEEMDQLVSEVQTSDETIGKPKCNIPSVDEICALLCSYVKEFAPSVDVDAAFNLKALKYISANIELLLKWDMSERDEWDEIYVSPYLLEMLGKDEKTASKISDSIFKKCMELTGKDTVEDDEDAGVDYVANCEFSLGYGAMVLLRKTKLKLVRGQIYGICGPNGCGKTTLLTAIAKGQVEGFPPQDKVKTLLVAHDLQTSENDIKIVDFILGDKLLVGIDKSEVLKTLGDLGFSEEMRNRTIGSLSGGWKMKLGLVRAVLMRTDLLLLDEPTNHLDVANVMWLQNYLNSLEFCTCLVISHDTKFLDSVCDNIIHYESKKLKTYKGNLSEFVKLKPEAKAYYTLQSSETLKFIFPSPGLLDGVNNIRKPVLRLKDVEFAYPNSSKMALRKVNGAVCLSSRIAVLGVNGAGKSTLIKVLTGEYMPQSGEVWKHPTLRVTYVAQSPLEYLNLHLDKTPNEYVQWRYKNGEDEELVMKQSRKMTPEEAEQMQKSITGKNGQQRRIEAIVGRAKLKKSFQYEVKWIGLADKHNSWIPREKLDEWGFQKLVQSFDDKMAGREGLSGFATKTLTQNSIQRHFEDFGLEPQFSTHGKIRGLSGGQKIKTVLASAMWGNPHMLILDEPTNYLDRESLAAFVEAINKFEGGVVIISHNSEFTDAICSENWYMDDGVLTVKGNTAAVDEEDGNESDGSSGSAASSTATGSTGDIVDDELDHQTGGPLGNAKISKASGKKPLTRKQKKELEYKEKRDALIALGIVPE